VDAEDAPKPLRNREGDGPGVNRADSIATLVTIVFGLMLAELFAGVHRLFRNRSRVRWHWLSLVVAWYVLAIVLKNWWALVFTEEGAAWVSGWVFFYYGHLLLLLFLVASAALPSEIPAEGIDLKQFYIGNRRYFWGLQAGVDLVLMLFALLQPKISGQPVNMVAVISNLIMAAVAVSLVLVRRIGYHAAVVLILVTLIVLEMAGKF
jgi:hypothetical protein